MTITLGQLAEALNGTLWGDGSVQIVGAGEPVDVAPSQDGKAQIALATSDKYALSLQKGAIALLADGMDPEAYGLAGAILVGRPRLAMAGLTRRLDAAIVAEPGIHPTAIIDPTARIGDGAAIGPFVVIGASVRIGTNARIGSHVSVGANTVIGDDATLHNGARIAHRVMIGDRFIAHPNAAIGSDGFSFVTPEKSGVEEIRTTLGNRDEIRNQKWVRIHSLGGVVIGDDVEVGANATVDSGTIRATSIGSGTKLDNLVQVGHNCRVGQDCLLCGQVGIAGSTQIGDRVVLGGQCGVSDNIFVGDDVIAGGATKIFTNVPSGRVILGSPATKMETQVEINKALRRLPRMAAKFTELEKAITRLLQKD